VKSLVDQAQARIKKIEDSISHQPVYHYPGQKYWYVMGVTDGGRVVALGPFVDEAEANNQLATLADGELFQYVTRDLAKATRQMKAELLSRGENPDDALKKMLHSKGLRREEERKRETK